MKNKPSTHVLGLAHPPIPVVRIGLIGLGNRGLLTLERYMLIEHVEIKDTPRKPGKRTSSTDKRRTSRRNRLYRRKRLATDVLQP